jgi:4-amino-4-deoxy-L-arabinose transferase-like glycosyltransferase
MRDSPSRLLAPVLLLLMGWFLYTFNLQPATLVGDDEGEHLYAAWRQAMGERVYRDVAFDAAPAPVYLGALAMQAAGSHHLVTKKLTIAFALLTGLFTFLLAERFYGRNTALLAMALLVTNAYWHFFGWFFTSDAFYICLYMASLYTFACAWQQPRRKLLWLLAGVLGAFAVFAKFFGVFALGGTVLFLALKAGRGASDERREHLRGLAWMAAGALAGAALFLLPMLGYFDRFYQLTVVHHRLAVPTLNPLFVFYAFFAVLWFEPTPMAHRLLLFLGLLGLPGPRKAEADDCRALMACHLAQALVFLAVPMEFYARHLLFALPLLSILAARQLSELAAQWGEAARAARWLGGWLFLSALLSFSTQLPAYQHWRLIELIQQHSQPQDTVLAEHGEVAFLARRRAVPLRDVPASGANPKAPRMDAREVIEAVVRERPAVALVQKKTQNRAEDNHFLGQLKDDHLLLEHLRSTYRTLETTDPAVSDYFIFVRP